MDAGISACSGGWISNLSDDKGVCKPTADICPGVWADTVAAYKGSHSLGDQSEWFGCPYVAGELDSTQSQIATGCCGGYQDMTETSGGQQPVYDILEGGPTGPSGWFQKINT